MPFYVECRKPRSWLLLKVAKNCWLKFYDRIEPLVKLLGTGAVASCRQDRNAGMGFYLFNMRLSHLMVGGHKKPAFVVTERDDLGVLDSILLLLILVAKPLVKHLQLEMRLQLLDG